MRRVSSPSPAAFARQRVAWSMVWVALVVLVVVVPAFDLAWGEMPRHGHPGPLHTSLTIAPAGITPAAPPSSSTPVVVDPAGSPPGSRPPIFIPPRP